MSQNQIDPKKADILIVDDMAANLNVLCQALESEGYNVIAAPSGEVALKIATQTPPDLILLDIMMPGIDGFGACRRLKAEPTTADVPVIFITAKDETQSIIDGFKVGGVDYITKPFRHEEVRARVRTHLTIKQLRDGLQHANDELEKAYSQLEADNERKTEELQTARVIQQGFLPDKAPEVSFLEIAPFQQPATEVSGDYYDFFPDGDDKLLVAIGDATGHGVGPSLMVSATKMALRTVDDPSLEKRIGQINTHLKAINRSHRLNMALTLVELSHDETSGAISVQAAGGGMPPLIIRRSDGRVEEIMVEGLPLGALDGEKYGLTEFRLEKEDVLILMSDGLPERLNHKGEMYGDTRLVTAIQNASRMSQNASEIVDALVKFGDDWSNGTPQNDDVTLVVLKVK